MNYKVLYRKYRPSDFENIVGQDYIIKTLKNSIKNGNISHAYIFSGPRGTGKTSTAKVFAKAINCLNSKDGDPCGECDFCLNFAENPDIIEIDAASNNGVDEIRTLIDNVKLTPTNGKYKVYIIDEVHMLSTSAFNALLLTLEEPPAHSIFILATTNIENVPITILSRCQRFDFQKIKIEDIVNRLKTVCEKENIDIEDEALQEIAELSDGGMRDSLSLLDQLSKNDQKITLELIEKQIKTISQKSINDFLDTIEDNDFNKCLEIINDYRMRAVDYKTLIKKIIMIASKKAKHIKLNGKIQRLNDKDYKNLVLKLAESLTKININVDAYTILEMYLLDFFETNDSKKNVVKEEVQEKSIVIEESKEIPEEITSKEKIKKEEVKVDNSLIDIRINNCFVGAQKKYLEEAKDNLNNYSSSINITGKIKAIMLDSTVVAASNTNLILTCKNDHNIDTANNMLNKIEESIQTEINKQYKLIFISESRWQKEKEKYIVNIKNKVQYKLMDEVVKEVDDNIAINDVFDKSKVEII